MVSWDQTEEPCYLNLSQREGKKNVSEICLISQALLLSTVAWGQGGKLSGTRHEFLLHLVKLLPVSHCETPWQSNQVPLVQFYSVPLDVFKLDCSRTKGHSKENSEIHKTGILIATICGAPWSIFVSDPVFAVQWGQQASN